MRRSQRAMLREHFERRRSITAQQALKLYGIARLAARIHEMREGGERIKRQMVAVVTRDGKIAHVAKYTRRG